MVRRGLGWQISDLKKSEEKKYSEKSEEKKGNPEFLPFLAA